MGKRYVRVRKDKLSDHIVLKDDSWSIASKRKLKAFVRGRMKRTYAGILSSLDESLSHGRISEREHKRLRAVILNISNDQIRNVEGEIDRRYNVEALNYHIEFPVKPLDGLEEGLVPDER